MDKPVLYRSNCSAFCRCQAIKRDPSIGGDVKEDMDTEDIKEKDLDMDIEEDLGCLTLFIKLLKGYLWNNLN